MSIVVMIMGALSVVLGLIGVGSPTRLIGIVRSVQSTPGLYAAAAVRLLLGAALFLSAPSSRWPDVFQGLGVLVFIAGLITPFLGVERFGRLLDWWASRGTELLRVWAGFTILFGLLLVFAFGPR